jgi:TetR/AcrR family tetracycline transcriptional repressor
MTPGPAAARPRRQGRRQGLKRGSLTPELIVRESLRLLDAGGREGFSLPKLGRALGADPTAIYRHFASKDDLILAISDHLISAAMAGLAAHDCWVDTLMDAARRLRVTYRLHPAAAALSASRATRRRAEMGIVDLLIGAVLSAGFEGAEAARVYRAVSDFALSWAGFEAFLALEANVRATDQAAWSREYLAADRSVHPHIWQLRTELPDVSDDDIFETILALVIGGLIRRAPRPCACAAHAG